ncbi:MAG: metallophosphoesterase [Alistipes sp.]
MRKIITLLCAICAWSATQAQAPSLHFTKEGKFKIAQFTDMHIDLGSPERRAEAEKTITQLRTILETEHPDFVVFTGDIVTGSPAAEGWRCVLDAVAERHTPFCVALGNHDAEQDLSRAQIAEPKYLAQQRAGRSCADRAAQRRQQTCGAALLSRLARLLEGRGCRWLRLVHHRADCTLSHLE